MEESLLQSERIEEIRNKMMEKRRKKARAEMNGSWNKSFGKKRHCPNASKILKASLKANNRALAKSLQSLKQENRIAQDMIIDLQNEQQVLLQSVYQMKQNEKENLQIRKAIQGALNEVTSSLLNAGNKLAYAMELSTSFPVRDSLRSSILSSDDDSLCIGNRASSLGPSVYYRKPNSERHPTPPVVALQEVPVPPGDDPSCRDDDSSCHGDVMADVQSQDPASECLDPNMIEQLDLDIPLMFTDDNLSEQTESGREDTILIKRRTRTSRISGLVDAKCANAAINTKQSSSTRVQTDVNPPAANTRARGTFVVAQEIAESPEGNRTRNSSGSAESTSTQPSNPASILNQTFEIGPKDDCAPTIEFSAVVPKNDDSNQMQSSKCEEEKQQAGEKTTYKVLDMELTKIENSEPPIVNAEKIMKVKSTGKDVSHDLPECDIPDKLEQDVLVAQRSGTTTTKVTKKKTKLPMKKAKTKVSLKKKDFQETFQSPKSPLMSPGAVRSGTGLSFRCVPSPVFGKVPKREQKLSKASRKGKTDSSVTSVFDLSEGDTFTEAKSFVLAPNHESVKAKCDVISPVKNASKGRTLHIQGDILEDQCNEHVESDDNVEKMGRMKKTKEKKKASRSKGKRKNVTDCSSEKQQFEDEVVSNQQPMSLVADAQDKSCDIQTKQIPETDERSEKDDGFHQDAALTEQLCPVNKKQTWKEDDVPQDTTTVEGLHLAELKETKIKRRSRKSKLVLAPGGRNSKTPPEDTSDEKEPANSKQGRKKSVYFPFDEQEEDASLFFITKPTIHRASKKRKRDKGTLSGSQASNKVSSANPKPEDVAVLSSEKEDNEEPQREDVTQSSETNVSPDEPKLPAVTDLLQDIDMVVKQRVPNEDATSKCKEQPNMKVKKPRKRSFIPVMQPVEQSTKGKSLPSDVYETKKKEKVDDGEPECQLEADNAKINHTDVSDEVKKGRPSSRRSSGSPVLHRTKRGRKRILKIESDDEEDDNGAPLKQTRRSITKGTKRLKRLSKQTIEELEDETDEQGRATGKLRHSEQKCTQNQDKISEDEIVNEKMLDKMLENVGRNTDLDGNTNHVCGNLEKVEEDEKAHYASEEGLQDSNKEPSETKGKGRKSKSKTMSKERQPVSAEDCKTQNQTDEQSAISKAKKRTKKSQALQDSEAQNGTAEIQTDTTKTLKEKELTSSLKERPSCSNKNNSQHKVSFQNFKLESKTEVETGQQGNQEVKDVGGRRSSRRAAGAVNYREPQLNSKLRRGDPHTSSDLLGSSDIFKGQVDKKKKKKTEKRKPLSNVMNTIDQAEMASLPEMVE